MRTKKHRFGKRLTALITVMCMIFTMLPINALAFNPDWYKTHIQSITIGKPATDTNGRKYLPVTVVFTADEDINDSNVVYFLEGYLKAKLANGKTAEGISGNGMTLVPVEPDDFDDAGINSYSWKWSQGGGKGAVKYKLPVLGASDTQTIEKSPYTGQKEVNGLKVGDEVTLSIETVFNKQNIPEEITKDLMSDEFEIAHTPRQLKLDPASTTAILSTSQTERPPTTLYAQSAERCSLRMFLMLIREQRSIPPKSIGTSAMTASRCSARPLTLSATFITIPSTGRNAAAVITRAKLLITSGHG